MNDACDRFLIVTMLFYNFHVQCSKRIRSRCWKTLISDDFWMSVINRKFHLSFYANEFWADANKIESVSGYFNTKALPWNLGWEGINHAACWWSKEMSDWTWRLITCIRCSFPAVIQPSFVNYDQQLQCLTSNSFT